MQILARNLCCPTSSSHARGTWRSWSTGQVKLIIHILEFGPLSNECCQNIMALLRRWHVSSRVTSICYEDTAAVRFLATGPDLNSSFLTFEGEGRCWMSVPSPLDYPFCTWIRCEFSCSGRPLPSLQSQDGTETTSHTKSIPISKTSCWKLLFALLVPGKITSFLPSSHRQLLQTVLSNKSKGWVFFPVVAFCWRFLTENLQYPLFSLVGIQHCRNSFSLYFSWKL